MENSDNDYKSKFLYHFTNKEILIEHILPTFQLKLNTLNNTNDPKEKKMSVDNYFEKQSFKYAGEYFDIKNNIKEFLDNDCKFCCFSGDYEFDNQKFDGFNLPRMWATYGDNHKGVCLKIDYNKFCQFNKVNNEDVFLRQMQYKAENAHKLKKRNKIYESDSEKVTKQIIRDNLELLFFTKHIDWLTEKEYRFLTLQQRDYCTIKESIVSVIVGMEFNKKYIPAIKEQSQNIDLRKIAYNYKTGHLEIKQ